MRTLLFVLLITTASASFAQTETDIRKHYTEVNTRIEESVKQGYEGPLYYNEWVTNKYERSWPATGRYIETTGFWYDDPPDHMSAAERNPKNVLLKVTVSRKTVDFSANEEYLYKDGKLLFYYSRETEEGNEWETRVYFNTKGVMFKNTVKANGKELTAADYKTEEFSDFKPHPAVILSDSKEYQELFVKSM